VDVDPSETSRIDELVWIFSMFAIDPYYRKQYLGVDLETLQARYEAADKGEALRQHLEHCRTNQESGVLESMRLTPIKEIMVKSIGGRERFMDLLRRGALATGALVKTQSPAQQSQIPLRCQLDLAPISGKIGEGNADAARGVALGIGWDRFVDNMREWIEDCLRYYSQVKG
jgi:hypothetical protein